MEDTARLTCSLPEACSRLDSAKPRPCSAWSRAACASWLAWAAFSALFLTAEVISSIDEAVSSRLEACFSVRWLRSALPREISSAPVLT